MKVLMHKKPNKRSSWSHHAKVGWCTGPKMLYCKCIKCCVSDTGGTITAEIFTCAHDKKIRILEITPQEELCTAEQRLTKDIENNPGIRSFMGDKIDELRKMNIISNKT